MALLEFRSYMDENLKAQIEKNSIRIVPDKKEEIAYQIKNIEKANEKLSKLRKKISELREEELKYAKYLYKFIEDNFGTKDEPVVEEKVEFISKKTVNKEIKDEFVRTLRIADTPDIENFFNIYTPIYNVIFTQDSLFEKEVQQHLSYCPPAVRIATLSEITKQVVKCHEILYRALSILSCASSDKVICSEAIDHHPNNHEFFISYHKILNEISQLLEVQSCQAVFFTPKPQRVLFPTETFTHIFDTKGTLCGEFTTNKRPQIISKPAQHPSYDSSRESMLFSQSECVLVAPFKSSKGEIAGLLLFENPSQKNSDYPLSEFLSECLSPILCFLRSLFLRVSPKHIAELAGAVAQLRNADDYISALPDKMKELIQADVCRLVQTSPEIEGIEVLKQGDSFIREASRSETSIVFDNPRQLKGFNTQIDDLPTLGRISSIMIIPIPKTTLVAVLYNSVTSTYFTPIQLSIARLFAGSVAAALGQSRVRGEVEELRKRQEAKKEEMLDFVSIFKRLTDVGPDKTLGAFRESLPQGVIAAVFEIVKGKALQIPTGRQNRIAPHLLNPGTYPKGRLLAISNGRYLILYEGSVNSAPIQRQLERMTDQLFLLLPTIQQNLKIKKFEKAQNNLIRAQFGDIKALGQLIGAEIRQEFYDEPKQIEMKERARESAYVENENGVTSRIFIDGKCTDDQIAVIKAFAQYQAVVDQEQKDADPETLEEIIKILLERNITEILGITEEELRNWIKQTFHIYATNGIDIKLYKLGISFINNLINGTTWSEWFSPMQLIGLLISILVADLNGIWKCQASEEVINLAEKATEFSAPLIASLFSGPAGLLNMEEQKKEELASLISDYCVDRRSSETSLVYVHVKNIASKGARNIQQGEKWIAKALFLFARMAPVAAGAATALEVYGEDGAKKEVYLCERVYNPMLTNLVMKNDKVLTVLQDVRSAIRELRTQLK